MSTGFEDFQNMLDDFFADSRPFARSLAGDTFKVDVQEKENEYIVEAEMPGIQKDEVSVSLDDGRLRISVNKQETSEQKDKNYIHRERRFSSMTRNIYLADSNAEGVKAKLDNGVLTIAVPKAIKADRSVQVTVE